MTIKYFSMFSGIGGFELGIKIASNDEFECIGYSEVDKYAESIYKRHFSDHIGWGDATEIRTDELPDFDLLVGGFPCQAFSVAGKRRGFDDTRGTLFFEIARILRDKRPRYFLLENVKGLLSHDKGKTFKTILEILSDLGYYVKWEVLNSKEFVPQNRERIFIEGYLRAEGRPEVLLEPRKGREITQKINIEYNESRSANVVDTEGICGTLTSGGQKSGGNTLIKLNKKPQAQTIYDSEGLACCLSANGGGDGGKTGLYMVDKCWGSTAPHASITDGSYTPTLCANNIGTPTPVIGEKKIEKVGNLSPSGHHGKNVYNPEGISPTLCAHDLYKNGVSIVEGKKIEKVNPQYKHQSGAIYHSKGISPALCATDYKDPVKIVRPVLTPDREKKRQNGRRMKDDGEPMFTLTATDKHGVTDGYKVRKLTPRECERLQAFPDDWTALGVNDEKISDTQRYKCCGNAVTTLVVASVIKRMFNLGDD